MAVVNCCESKLNATCRQILFVSTLTNICQIFDKSFSCVYIGNGSGNTVLFFSTLISRDWRRENTQIFFQTCYLQSLNYTNYNIEGIWGCIICILVNQGGLYCMALVGIELVSSSARVTSVKFQQRSSLTHLERPDT